MLQLQRLCSVMRKNVNVSLRLVSQHQAYHGFEGHSYASSVCGCNKLNC